MHRSARLALALTALVTVCALGLGPGAFAQKPVRVVKTADNAKLKRTILVNRRGLSLYDLSAERNGRFICTTRVCLSFWTPLTVKAGTRPTGVRALSTIKRPDGKRQVAYRGRPLYTFNDDRPGDVNGEGFEDVGVWHVVALRGSQPRPPAPGPYDY